MATPAQTAANQANARKSTGPRTEAGKERSAANRLSHGFLSNTTLMPGEDPLELQALTVSLIKEFNPAGMTEQILVEKMVHNQWLSLRAFRLQGIAFSEHAATGESGLPKELALLIRYQTSADRAFHKAHNELVKTQKERKMSEIGFEPQEPVEAAQKPPRQPVKMTTDEEMLAAIASNDLEKAEKLLQTRPQAA